MKISEIIVEWYVKNKRDLPWRENREVYSIWLSEIILQQTRVQQGLAYYQRFISAFPEVRDLAEADEQEVLRLWQGLGYYSRARNLHFAATQVVENFSGVFPNSYKGLLQLKGVGKYTAAAIASIAYKEPVAVVDGNVSRVLSRLFAVEEAINTTKGEKKIQELAAKMLDRDEPGEHNQAVMEFGALHCTPSSPLCSDCPFQFVCKAYEYDLVDVLPAKVRKIKIKERFFAYYHFIQFDHTYICKREKSDIWKHMYEFPLKEFPKRPSDHELMDGVQEILGLDADKYVVESISVERKHVLSHRHIYARFVQVKLLSDPVQEKYNLLKINEKELIDYPLPRLIDSYLEGLVHKA